MERLVALGYAREYRHGGHEITDAGRETLRLGIMNADAEASSALGNSNEAREAGNVKGAERWLARAQVYLDEANDLRGLS